MGAVQPFWIELDVVVSETHNATTRVTTNPVQNGAEVANNAINDPITLSVVGGVTDTPFFTQSGNFGGSVSGITGAFSGSSDNAGTRTQQAYEALLSLKNEQILIYIDTKLRTYTNMMLVGISTTTDKNTYNAPIFNLEFKEIITVDDVDDDGNKGNQSPIPPSPTDLTGITLALGNLALGAVLAS